MIRYQAVEGMKQGLSPTKAVMEALNRIIRYNPDFSGALIAVNVTGHYGNVVSTLCAIHQDTCTCPSFIHCVGAAFHGLSSFPYTVFNPELKNSTVINAEVFAP